MSKATLIGVDMQIVPDECPDTSYLEQEGFEDRLANYQNDDFTFVGVRAVAEVDINGIRQQVQSPGLWGIESDSGDDYFREVYQDELNTLLDMLQTLHVTVSDDPQGNAAGG